MLTRVLAAAAMMAAGGTAMGQAVVWTQRVHELTNPDPQHPYHNFEVALDVNPLGTDVMVAWINAYGQGLSVFDSEVRYNVSVDGEVFNQGYAGPLPGVPHDPGLPGGGDPMVAFSRTNGMGWVGSLDNLNLNGFYVSGKPATQQQANTAYHLELPVGVDKGWLASGPDLLTGVPALYLTFARGVLREVSSTTNLGSTWNTPDVPVGPNGGISGGCPSSAILHNQTFAGRRIVAFQTTALPASATYLTSAGLWQVSNPQPALALVPLSDPQQFEQISAPLQLLALGNAGAKMGCVAMAVDPTDARVVYLVFSGTAASSGGSANIDLFIAQSIDGGASFPQNRVLHLRDVDLGEPGITHQIVPGVAVDTLGGVNIVYYEVANPTDSVPPLWTYHVKYARVLPPFTSSPPNSAPHQYLTQYPYALDVPGFALADDGQTLFSGDYISLAPRGCYVYAGYMSRHEGGPMSVYVSKICICSSCIVSDMNSDGALTQADPLLFADYYLASDPRADINRDTQVGATDVSRFFESYSCGCNPP